MPRHRTKVGGDHAVVEKRKKRRSIHIHSSHDCFTGIAASSLSLTWNKTISLILFQYIRIISVEREGHNRKLVHVA
jgi:hypothetical protein